MTLLETTVIRYTDTMSNAEPMIILVILRTLSGKESSIINIKEVDIKNNSIQEN
jgi:hypothetical protein